MRLMRFLRTPALRASASFPPFLRSLRLHLKLSHSDLAPFAPFCGSCFLSLSSLRLRHEKEIANLVACAFDRLELRCLHELVVGSGSFDAFADAAEKFGAGKDAGVVLEFIQECA